MVNRNSLLYGMTHQNRSRSDSAATSSQAARETTNIRDRVQTLREKTTTLSETLDRIERDLREAAGETKE